METGQEGNRSIRYKCETRIWDKKTVIFNEIFTFKPNGEFAGIVKFVNGENADAGPKKP